MRPLELLSPAKTADHGMAAIDHGADAVYIGPEHFGARAAAGNSLDDIARLCSYAHQYGARVYATVNTIVYDHELEQARQLLADLSQAGADAVLIQDMALASGPRPLPLHASTQTDNRSASKVAALARMGFQRVVLARELSIAEVAAIHRAVPGVELEVFVHGALCVSYSGQCYASQHCFRRSANRGECAQFCRMKFDLVDADGQALIAQRHLLSLRDLNLSAHLEALAQAGATSFKIEGRLKDLAYVKNVTAAYSQLLDQLVERHPDSYCRASLGKSVTTFTPSLESTFNRGYTNYFALGRQPHQASPDTPKATGPIVATVKSVGRGSITVANVAAATIANGDGLCFTAPDGSLDGFRVNRAQGTTLFPQHMPRRLTPGTKLHRNLDQLFLQQLSRPTARRLIPISLKLDATPTGYQLSATVASAAANVGSGFAPATATATVEASHQEALTPQQEQVANQLTRLGGTPFTCIDITLPKPFTSFIPNSLLASLRRQAVTRLAEAIAASMHPAAPLPSASTVPGGYAAGSSPTTDEASPAPAHTYLLNIANREAAAFYHADQPTAYELSPPRQGALIMQCRYCLLHELGHCLRRHADAQPRWKLPLSLRLADGRVFPLEFDCQRCQMNVRGN